MQAVILAAGKSTRTYPLTLTRPKPLLPVLNRPLLGHQLDALRGHVDEVVVVVGYMQEMVRDAFGEAYGDLRIRYAVQEEQKGTGHAVLQCRDLIDGPFLVVNGDDLYAREDLGAMAAADEAALVKEIDDPGRFGVVEADGDRIVRVVEKPKTPVSNLASIGAYRFTPEVFAFLDSAPPSPRGEIEITSALQWLADAGRLQAVRAKGFWLPVGYPWDLLAANAHFLDEAFDPQIEGDVSNAAHLSGAVDIGEGTRILPGVVIEGPVCIGRDCTIGPNCWVRPYSVIGHGCKVGHAVEIKASVLFDGARVPHLSYVGDSIVGANANLGCGTITANFRHDGGNHKSMVKGELIDTGRRKLGAIIGDDVHTGINTSIYPGRKLWPRTGTLPGEVVQRDKET